jgi:hypothetical protein
VQVHLAVLAAPFVLRRTYRLPLCAVAVARRHERGALQRSGDPSRSNQLSARAGSSSSASRHQSFT